MSHGLSLTWLVPESSSWKTRAALRLLRRQAWHPDHSAGSVWIRSYQVAPYLEDLGHTVRCNALTPLPQAAVFLRRHTAADLVLAQQLKAQGVKIIVEVVVDYFETRTEAQAGYGASPVERRQAFTGLVELADQVWAVSPFLAQKSQQYNPHSHFVSDSVDPRHFSPGLVRNPQPGQPLTIGWSGMASKAHVVDDLSAHLLPWLESGRVKLLLASEKPIRLASGMPFEFKRWRHASFPSLLRRCDLCLAPRQVNDNYNRGHSLFKIGVFMALGVPALAGPVPSYDLLLADCQAGAICHTPEEWENQLKRFILDAGLRRRAGQMARERMRPYLTPQVAAQIHQLLGKL